MDNPCPRTLSPRLRCILHKTLDPEKAQEWCSRLPDVVDSIMAITTLFSDGEELAKAVGADTTVEATAIWEAADDEADAVVAAMAKVRAVANRHAPRPTQENTTLARPGTVPYTKVGGDKRARTGPAREEDAQKEADMLMEQALEQAFNLADEAGAASRRVSQINATPMSREDRRGLLRNLFLHKVGVAATLKVHLRNTARLKRWAAGKQLNPWALTELQLACYLRDESRSGNTVGMMLKATLDWLQFSLDLGWNVTDPLLLSMAGKNRRAARAGREQATPIHPRRR